MQSESRAAKVVVSTKGLRSPRQPAHSPLVERRMKGEVEVEVEEREGTVKEAVEQAAGAGAMALNAWTGRARIL